MFEDSLLIIKNDYLQKRKPILLNLLQKGFQIQGHRRLLFSPEHAAEFYDDYADRKEFMLLVIMLSKGISEAFILARENCVEELMNTMVCYFGNSNEMGRNVHVSLREDSAHREISFIFPNYIHEPISAFYEAKFSNSDLVKDMMVEAYDLVSGANCSPQCWKDKLAEWLTHSNAKLPRIYNQCRGKLSRPSDEKSTSASPTVRATQPCTKIPETPPSSIQSSFSISSVGSSMIMTSSSCITCSCFDGGETCYPPPKKDDSFELLVKSKTTKLDSSTPSGSADHVHEEEVVEWQEMVEDGSHGSEVILEQDREEGDILDDIRPLDVTNGYEDRVRSSQVEDQGRSVGPADGAKFDHITPQHLKPPEGKDQVGLSDVKDGVTRKDVDLAKVAVTGITEKGNLNEDKVSDADNIESIKGSASVIEYPTMTKTVEYHATSEVIIETDHVYESQGQSEPIVKMSSSSSSVILMEKVPSTVPVTVVVTDEPPPEEITVPFEEEIPPPTLDAPSMLEPIVREFNDGSQRITVIEYPTVITSTEYHSPPEIITEYIEEPVD